MWFIRLLFCVVVTYSLPVTSESSAATKTLLVAVGADKPPFVISTDNGISGLEVDIFRAAMAESEYQIEFVALPFHQLNRALLNFEDLDAAAGIGTEFFAELYYVDEFSHYQNVAISKKASGIALQSVRDLFHHRVIAWQGASQAKTPLGEVFYQLYGTGRASQTRYQELNQYNQNAMFWLGRTDVIVLDKTIFGWYRSFLSNEMDTSAEITIHPIFPNFQYTRAAFRDPELAQVFAEGLSRLKESGRYQQFYNQYFNQGAR